jgi:D-alanyl-D-alanine carboxypeptidase
VSAPQQASRAQPPALSPEAPRTIVASADPAGAVAVAAKPEAQLEAKPESRSEIPNSLSPAQAHAHGWLIQIGAFEGEDEARQHLSEAQTKVRTALAAADPFTERVQKGDKALYRARFAGFDKTTAEAACKQLKRSDFECMPVKN